MSSSCSGHWHEQWRRSMCLSQRFIHKGDCVLDAQSSLLVSALLSSDYIKKGVYLGLCKA